MRFPERNLVENNISMIISPAENNRTFSCRVINDYLQSIGQILQKNITLQVACKDWIDFYVFEFFFFVGLVGPSSVQIRDNKRNVTKLIEGIPRQFVCRTSVSNPRAMVVWKLDEKILSPDIDPLEESGEFGGRIIQLTKTIGLDKSLRSYHQKILSCEAKNPETGHIVVDSTQLNITCS
jgi:hypothetical protein